MHKLFYLLALLFIFPRAVNSENNYDVIVYGATASGLISALEVADSGYSTVVLEPSSHLGGMLTGGLSNTDIGEKKSLGGKAREFFLRLRKHYKGKHVWKFEPSAAQKVFEDWLREKSISIIFNSEISSVDKIDSRITSIKLAGGNIYTAKYFIDASYEADLMSLANISYAIGREAKATYNEEFAGFRGTDKEKLVKKHSFNSDISPFDQENNLLPGVAPAPERKEGDADKAIPTYNFRLCVTKNDKSKITLPIPKNYQANRFEVLGRYLEKNPGLNPASLFSLTALPNGKFDLNSRGPFSTDFIGASWQYPEASYKERKEIWQDHKNYTLGFFHFLKTDQRVPEKIKRQVSALGLCRDEFTETNNWPPQLYIRVAKRMLGEYVMTEKDLRSKRTKVDSIAIGSRPIELRHVQRLALADTTLINEGHKTVFVDPYEIPFRSILPKRKESENLIVPVAASASYVAYNSLRMEPVYMMLGHAAGAATSLALRNSQAVQDVDYNQLKEKLLQEKQIISLTQLQ